MATYKVIQDIEAEDKFLGPFTLKQFIFAAIGVVFSYLSFVVTVRGAWFVAIPFVPVAFFGYFMAVPWSKDQPTDLWVLAKIRFRIKPKKRIWDQAGRQDLVTITAPKTEVKPLTKDLSETEVQSRLKALADTMNTRGWAVKHAPLPNLAVSASDPANSMRLIPTPIPVGSRAALDEGTPDIMENTKVDALISQSEKTRKAELKQKIEQARQTTTVDSPAAQQPVIPGDDTDDLAEELRKRKEAASLATGNMQKLQPKPVEAEPSKPKKTSKQDKQPDPPKTEEEKTVSTVTEPPHPDIISLAHNNDLNVATLARQANKDDDDSQEVVISLH